MTLATETQEVALELLEEFGEVISLSTFSGESDDYNTETGGVDSDPTVYSGVGHPSSYRAFEMDGNSIQRGDIKLLLYTTSTPLTGDQVELENGIYRVMDVDKKRVQGVNINYYVLQLRKS